MILLVILSPSEWKPWEKGGTPAPIGILPITLLSRKVIWRMLWVTIIAIGELMNAVQTFQEPVGGVLVDFAINHIEIVDVGALQTSQAAMVLPPKQSWWEERCLISMELNFSHELYQSNLYDLGEDLKFKSQWPCSTIKYLYFWPWGRSQNQISISMALGLEEVPIFLEYDAVASAVMHFS